MKQSINPHWEQFQRSLASYTVAVTVRPTNSEGAVVGSTMYRGSGVLVRYRGLYMIATCAHTFEHVQDGFYIAWAIGQNPGGGQRFQLGLPMSSVHIPPRPRGGYKGCSTNDLGLILVDPEDFTPFGHAFWDLTDPPKVTGNGLLIAYGNPGVFHEDDAVSGISALSTACVPLVGMIKKDIDWDGSRARYPKFKAKIEFLEYLIRDEVSVLSGTMGGMSGGGVWCQQEDGSPRLLGLCIAEDPPGEPTHFEGVYLNLWMDFADAFLKRSLPPQAG